MKDKYDTTNRERNVLRIMMNDKDSLPQLLDCIKDDWIKSDARKFIFDKIKDAYHSNQSAISKETLFYEVDKRFDDEFDHKTITEHKSEIDMVCQSQTNENIDFMVNKFQEAELIKGFSYLLEDSYLDLEKGDWQTALKKVMENMENPASFSHKPIQPSKDCLDDFVLGLGNGSRKMTGLETGFEPYDNKLSGINGLTILSGSPGAGKSALVAQLACGCAENNIPVLFYSLEMGKNEVLRRNLCRYSEVDMDTIMLDGRIYLDDNCQSLKRPDAEIKTKLTNGYEKIKSIADKYHIHTVEDERPLDFDVLKSDIQGTKEKFNTEEVLVIVDQLQDFPVTERFGNSIDIENHKISNLKRIHTQTKVPIILLCHQNKVGMQSKNANMTDIKGSANNTYTPDVVLSLIDPNQGDNYSGDCKPVNLHIIKNRNGKKNFFIPLDFTGKHYQFTERKSDNGGLE